MIWWEKIIIILAILFPLLTLIVSIIKKKNGKATSCCDCSCCTCHCDCYNRHNPTNSYKK